MATYNELQKDIGKLAAQLAASRRVARLRCFHRESVGEKRGLMQYSVALQRGLIRAEQKNVTYSPTTMVCIGHNGCNAIFEGARYERAEIEAALFQIQSMFEQLKWIAGSPQNFPGGPSKLDDVCIAIDVIESFFASYIEVSNTVANKKDKEKENGKRKRGNTGGYGLPGFYNK